MLVKIWKYLVRIFKKPKKRLDKIAPVCYSESISVDSVQEEPIIIKEEDIVPKKSQFEIRKLKEAAKAEYKESLDKHLTFSQQAIDIIWNVNIAKFELVLIDYDVESGMAKVVKRLECYDKSVGKLFEMKKQAILNLFKIGDNNG